MEVEPIGVIHTPFATKDDCPIQPVFAAGCRGTVTLDDRFAAGLKDIELFSHIYLLYLFDRAGEVKLVRPTFLDDEPHGVFASRHPCRPNGIGMSIVKLDARRGNVLEVEGIDVLDGTPLIDIKPYIPRFDCFGGASEGWLVDKDWRPKPAGRE
ncbi:tRNA (N6-threonylcarbamoyladenosine(37)-N6)-methyltransferase TrmO [Geomesophilobacter sediminis]|uniref:tRNA (N6-threonylcarbamoyladenosine(37)-N6)-methyltransferase TrmO n=1 Tax=Geomesophilobacter sediminis TaxID=2798584 RepID=A0A8J7JFC7_9BACT|nr:tRNA (N6-threonylcarbamoyladenosine(37)-N6)-methyltransferase TrmO [Geomesophilobacter sediminis]MBJ6724974.1 tRNA (N6-threonylcarbamoyladenosine(37)-N6)-methyltransferase TrmO [Geomesophilobacter sediminis]